jgi:hypothetical protein
LLVTAPPKPSSDVHISDEIRSKCGIPDEDAYFAFNSAAVTATGSDEEDWQHDRRLDVMLAE